MKEGFAVLLFLICLTELWVYFPITAIVISTIASVLFIYSLISWTKDLDSFAKIK